MAFAKRNLIIKEDYTPERLHYYQQILNLHEPYQVGDKSYMIVAINYDPFSVEITVELQERL